MTEPTQTATGARQWWEDVGLADARASVSTIDNIEAADPKQVACAIPLFLLSGGSQAAIADRIAAVTDAIWTAVMADPTSSANQARTEAWCGQLIAVREGISRLPQTFSVEARELGELAEVHRGRCQSALAQCGQANLKRHADALAATINSRRRPPAAGSAKPPSEPTGTE